MSYSPIDPYVFLWDHYFEQDEPENQSDEEEPEQYE